MTFLYTVFLPVLVAAAIPILLHILSRQRLPLIPFSSLRFLELLQKRKARRINLRQILLLILRTLAIVALVVVFARPALQSRNAAGSAAAVEMVIILDDGLTSSVESRDGQLHRLALRQANRLLDLAGPNDHITLITTSEPDGFLSVPTGQRDIVRSRLEGSSPHFTTLRIDNALTIADSLFDASDRFNRELYIISNFYGSIWDSISVMETESARMVRRFLLPVGPENLPNLSIGQVELKSSILQQGRPVEMDVVLRNHSSQVVRTALVSVYLDDQRVAQASIDIAGKATAVRTFSVTPERTGQLVGWIKFEDVDPLAVDSRRYFILDIPDSLRVMVVAPDSSARMVIQAAFAGDEAQFVRLNWGDPNGWETASLAGYDVLLLAGVPTVSAGAARRVAEFVQRGGGIVLFQGTETDLADLSRGLWDRLGFAGARGTTVQGGIGWGRIDLEHPLFTGMFEGEGSPKSPSLRFSVDLVVGDGDYVIIPFSDGRPLLIERQVGAGRALLYAVPLESQSGDFIYAGIFAPLLFRSVCYVSSSGRNGQSEWETGHRYRTILSLPRAVAAQLTLPDGDRRELPPRPVVGGVEYNVGFVELPGIYDLSVDNRIIARYSANVPNDLSNLVRDDLNGTGQRFGDAVVIDENEEELTEIIYNVRYGRELWRQTAVIFLLLLVVESLLGRSSGKEDKMVG